MSSSALRIPKSDPRQDAALARALRLGVRFKVSLGKAGWLVKASGPGGAARMLLPRERRSIRGPLVALCGIVCGESLGAAGGGGSRCERQGGFGGSAAEHPTAAGADKGDAA